MCSQVVGISKSCRCGQVWVRPSVYFWDLGTDNLPTTRCLTLAPATPWPRVCRSNFPLYIITYQAGTQRMPYYAQLGLMPVATFASRLTNGHVHLLCTRSSVRETQLQWCWLTCQWLYDCHMSMLNGVMPIPKNAQMHLQLLKCEPLLNIRKNCLPLLPKTLIYNIIFYYAIDY